MTMNYFKLTQNMQSVMFVGFDNVYLSTCMKLSKNAMNKRQFDIHWYGIKSIEWQLSLAWTTDIKVPTGLLWLHVTNSLNRFKAFKPQCLRQEFFLSFVFIGFIEIKPIDFTIPYKKDNKFCSWFVNRYTSIPILHKHLFLKRS